MAERECSSCGSAISAARLAAVPYTDMCVPCVEARGDVMRIKKHEDWDMALENCAETYYFSNPYFEHGNLIRGQVGYTTTKEEAMS